MEREVRRGVRGAGIRGGGPGRVGGPPLALTRLSRMGLKLPGTDRSRWDGPGSNAAPGLRVYAGSGSSHIPATLPFWVV